MSGYTLFNRHTNMDGETLSEIGNLIMEVRFGDKGDNGAGSWELINQLFGLYDGYLYDELLVNAQDLPKPLFRRIIKVWVIVSKYPSIQYVAGIDEEVEEAAPVEYYKGMGVAEGKKYLAYV
jgi:hypothetical protein